MRAFFKVIFVFNSLQFNMGTLFLSKDGHGTGIDGNVGPEFHGLYIVDQNQFIGETIC